MNYKYVKRIYTNYKENLQNVEGNLQKGYIQKNKYISLY